MTHKKPSRTALGSAPDAAAVAALPVAAASAAGPGSAAALPHKVRPFEYLEKVAQRKTAGAPSAKDGALVAAPCCSPNVRILALVALLFGTITSVQFVAALIANSNALLVDCICMAVDTLSFCGNIVGEWITEGGWLGGGDGGGGDSGSETAGLLAGGGGGERSLAIGQLVGSGFSLLALVGFASWFLVKAAFDIADLDEAADDVNPWIVFGFACAGLVFDASSLVAFRVWGDPANADSGEKLNMGSALLHVLADSLRSIVTLVESLLIFRFPDTSSALFDAWATLVVAGLVIAAAVPPFVAWGVALCCGAKPEKHAYEPLP